MAKKSANGSYRFVYEIELPASADPNAFLERFQTLVAGYNGSAGGAMVGMPSPTTRFRILDVIHVERDAPELGKADVVTMTEGRALLGIPSQSGMSTYVRLKHAPIVIDLSEANPQRRNRLLRTWVIAEMRRRKEAMVDRSSLLSGRGGLGQPILTSGLDSPADSPDDPDG